MQDSSGNYHADPIRGDVFIDKTLGYSVFMLALVVLGAAIYRLIATGQEAVELPRIVKIGAAMVASLWIACSTPAKFKSALLVFCIRCAVDLWHFPENPKDRYLAMELFFDLGMIWYCVFRMRSLRARQVGK